MSVSEYTANNIFLFGGFWLFSGLLGFWTAVMYIRAGYSVWLKIIGILGGSALVYFGAFVLAGNVFRSRYYVVEPPREFTTTGTAIDLLLVPIQLLAIPSLERLDVMAFHFLFTTLLWLLVMGITILLARPVKEMR